MKSYIILVIFLLNTFPCRTQIPDFSLVGFATQNGGTTGGTGGTEVFVNTFEELELYAETPSTSYIIYITDTISGTGSVANGNYDGSIRVESNKTVIGLDSTAFLDGVGFTMNEGSNIIIKNLKFCFISIAEAIPEGSHDIPGIYSEFGDEGRAQILVNGGDLISIRGESKNIWIDHCELYSENPAVQKNQDLYDGLIDIKNQTGFITISWCYLHDHWKTHLVGANDSDLYGDRKITYHHNRYENVNSRLPFYRGSVGHVFNNYIYKGLNKCVNPRLGACLKVEKNFFEDSRNTVAQTDSGFAELLDNKEVNCNNTGPYPPSCKADLGYTYDNVLTTNVEDVKEIVIRHSGIGKLPEYNTGFMRDTGYREFSVYPNPVRDKVTVSCPHIPHYRIELRDMQGRLIISDNLSGSDIIDLDSVEKGIYMMTLIHGIYRSTQKIIKE